MRRLIATLVVGGMLVLGVAPVTADQGGNMGNASCTFQQEFDPGFFFFLFDSHGDCVETGRTAVVDTCKTDFAPMFENRGACVSYLRSMGA